MMDMLLGPIGWIAGAIAAIVAAWVAGKRSGAVNARAKAQGADNDRAEQIRRAADSARGGGGNPVDRLSDAKRIRD